MRTFKNLTILFGIVALTACNQATMEGSWLEPVPGMPGKQQGLTLKADGSAVSIHMATLQYEKWKHEGNTLFLSGTSIGNKQSIPFTDTLTVERLTPDSLILRKGELLLRYAKYDKGSSSQSTLASQTAFVNELQPVKGELIIGHEVRSFVAEGDTTRYWVTDGTGNLLQKYNEETKGIKNGKPVYVELEVIDMGKAKEGFATDYTSVYHVLKIHKLKAK